MTRPRRDPRAERAARLVQAGLRPRLLPRDAVVPTSGRKRRDPRGERAAAVAPAPRLRLDRLHLGGGTAPVVRAAVKAAAPAIRVIDNPAFLILVVADAPAGRLSPHDRQLLGAARLLADAGNAGGAVRLLAPDLAEPAGPAGADQVSPLPAEADPERRVAAIAAMIAATAPRHVLFPESETGGDLARRVAARLGETLFAEAEQITARAVSRKARAGRIEQRRAPPRLLTVIADCVAPHRGPPHAVTVCPPEVAESRTRLMVGPRIPADPATVKLTEADFVVSAGNGVTDFAGFAALARALNATPAGSRVVCDAGHLPRERQVGASGSVLDAACYLALGIAGAPQHLQGIARVQHVVAVNTDLHAAMIARAGLSIIADAQRVIPALLTALAEEAGAAGNSARLAGAPENRTTTGSSLAPETMPFTGTATVLLSAGRHPVSFRPAAVPVETQAVRLARDLGATVTGLHAGTEDAGLREHLGMGLDTIGLLPLSEDGDPLPALAAHLRATAPALILAGQRGQGSTDGGLLPYLLAETLGLPIVADAAALRLVAPGLLLVTQALPRGARREVRVALPAVVTVHPAAPAPLSFAYARARRGGFVPRPVGDVALASAVADDAVEERPYRRRPRLLEAGTSTSEATGRVLIDPTPDEAAREILAHLRRIGVLRPTP